MGISAFAAQDTTSNITAAARISCEERPSEEVVLEFSIPATGDPIGTLFVCGGVDSASMVPLGLKHGEFSTTDATAITHADGASAIAVNDPAADAKVLVTLPAGRVPRIVGWGYTRSSGGDASGLTARVFRRGNVKVI